MTDKISVGALVLSILSFGIGFALERHGWAILLVSVTPLFWIGGHRWHWRWISGFSMFWNSLLAALAIYLDVPDGWAILGLVSILGHWDLVHWMSRMQDYEHEKEFQLREREHIRTLGGVLGGGVILAFLGSQIRIRLGFMLLLVLAVIAVLGIGIGVQYGRKSSE